MLQQLPSANVKHAGVQRAHPLCKSRHGRRARHSPTQARPVQAGTCRCPTRVAGGRPRDTRRRPRSRPACGSLTCGAPGAGKGSSRRPRGRAVTLGVLPAHPQGRAGPQGRHAANEPGRPGPGSSVPRGWPAGQSARIPGAWLPARPRPRNPDPVTRWPYRAPGGTSLRSPRRAEQGAQQSEARCPELRPRWQATRRAQVPVPGGSVALASHAALGLPGLSPRREGSTARPSRRSRSRCQTLSLPWAGPLSSS